MFTSNSKQHSYSNFKDSSKYGSNDFQSDNYAILFGQPEIVPLTEFGIMLVETDQRKFYLPSFFPKQALVFMCLQYKSFENNVGKGEIARNEQFLLFPVFSTLLETSLPFSSNLKIVVCKLFEFERV